ncbi:acyl-homoserine-lactone synthase [Bradyrhizobium sp. STM 3557]|uniref:acyl-homoserine-lactone synthase n=1 Tax=Bradyrhizobium sp. STM 3557 TaxID=578920 RepID=UPI00388F40C3
MRTIALTWETAHQYGEAWISHHRLRYRMFVERQRWNVPSYRQLEYDQFDTPAATYILVVDDHNRTLGTTRLIPTTRPYMVETLWPDLIDIALPHLPAIWEASRFGCDRDLDAVNRRQVVAQLIQGCQEFGVLNGIERYLGVMPAWIFKHVIGSHGCPVTILRSRAMLGGDRVEAAYIDVSPSVLDAVRQHTGLNNALTDPNPSPPPFRAASRPPEGLQKRNGRTGAIRQPTQAVRK